MWGSKDPAVYFSSMELLARHFANVQTVVFPGVGHLPYEECPEEFNRALISFCQSESSKVIVRCDRRRKLRPPPGPRPSDI